MASSPIQSGVITTRESGSQPKRSSDLVLYRIAKGRTRWSIDGDSYLLREGDIFIVLPGQVFSGTESSESALLQVEWIKVPLCEGSKRLTKSALARTLRAHPDDAQEVIDGLHALPRPVLRPAEFLARYFHDLATKTESDHQLYRRTSILPLLFELSRSRSGADGIEATNRSPAESDVALFLSELESRCEENWTLESMAKGAGLKRSRFGTLCRKLTGESPAVYLNRLRIRKSRKLLRDTESSVTEIAFDCGFSSSQYFAKTFRRFQGHEPTHYRRVARDMSLGRGIQYLKGDSARTVAYARDKIGAGDFEVSGEIMLDRLGDTAASLEFGADRFGFDGREGCFFLEGSTFGEAQFFHRSAEIIREGEFFPFLLKRNGKTLTMSVDGHSIFSLTDDPRRDIGLVGLRPLRNGIRVQKFEINKAPESLRVPTT
ncbi:MAG: helix-turn-helix domain-containing protein [Verrucomicrobiota bacterium]